jgi:type IV secretory pathway VirB2 component (pilin)
VNCAYRSAPKTGFLHHGAPRPEPRASRPARKPTKHEATEEVIEATPPPGSSVPARCPVQPPQRKDEDAPVKRRGRRDEHADIPQRASIRRAAAVAAMVALHLAMVAPAGAEEEKPPPKPAPPPDLKAVVDRFQDWLLTFATGLAVLALTVAGIFYLFSAGNPAQVERAKLIVRATVIGYSLMVLAPMVLRALQAIVG